jgi:ABC-type transport system involved in multi-copper enzyme maturation permease subunit
MKLLTGPQLHTLWNNPVLVKEIRTRMRGKRAFIILTAHLLALGSAVFLAYLVFQLSSSSTTPSLESRRSFGKSIFGLLVGLELVMISFTAPALTSGAIAAERERQTYDLLRVTLLPPKALVIGKFAAGLVFIVLLLFTSLPLQSPAFLIGGVVLQEILVAVFILLVTATAFCAAGMFFSSLFSRALFSTVLSYAFAIFLVFGIPMILLFLLTLVGVASNNIPVDLPRTAQAGLALLGWIAVSITPVTAIIATEAIFLSQHNIWAGRVPLWNNVEFLFPSPWIPYVIYYLTLSIIFLWLSIERVRRVER